ncbi:MAG: fibronectin type III domain-containing protein [Verrucomicrobiota bacterium]
MSNHSRSSTWLVGITSAAGLFSFTLVQSAHGLDARDFAVEVTATVEATPPQIQLQWPAGSLARGYTVARKLLRESRWTPLATPQGTSKGFLDTNIVAGAAYEYEVTQVNTDGVVAYGYCYAGLEVPFPSSRGRIVLVVDNSVAADLATELIQWENDAVGDGWTVLRHDVARTLPAPEIKALI